MAEARVEALRRACFGVREVEVEAEEEEAEGWRRVRCEKRASVAQ